MYLTVLHMIMIGRSKKNERLHGMTINGVLLYVNVSPKKII